MAFSFYDKLRAEKTFFCRFVRFTSRARALRKERLCMVVIVVVEIHLYLYFIYSINYVISILYLSYYAQLLGISGAISVTFKGGF